MPKLCAFCGKDISSKRKSAKFCSLYCLCTSNNKNKIFTEEHRKKLSIAKKGKPLSEQHRRHLSEALKKSKKVNGGNWTKERRKKASEIRKAFLKRHPEMHPNNLCRNKKSYPQTILAIALSTRGYIVQTEVFHKGYWLDIVINSRLNVEVDGEYWHKSRKERDRNRDAIISRDYLVLRIPAKQVLSDINKCIANIGGLV